MMLVYVVIALVLFILWLIFVDGDAIISVYDLLHRKFIPEKTRIDFFKGKVVWITGASSGIGKALALEVAKYGCRLVLSSRRETKLEDVKVECLREAQQRISDYKDNDILILPMDILNKESHITATEKIKTHFSKIDILVNNAGRTQRCTFEEIDVAVMDELLDLDMMCHIYLTKCVLPIMINQRSGHIVNINSVCGKFSPPGTSLYSAAKFGLMGFMDSLRLEVTKYGICVTNVCPGQVQTELFENAFTKDINVRFGDVNQLSTSAKTKLLRLTPERCAHLTTISIIANLKEIWIGKGHMLLMVYISQYFPTLGLFLGTLLSSKRVQSLLKDSGVQGKKD